jgi:hypothetical protein
VLIYYNIQISTSKRIHNFVDNGYRRQWCDLFISFGNPSIFFVPGLLLAFLHISGGAGERLL